MDNEVIVLRDIPKQQAKREVLEYFREHPGSYPSDVAIVLRLDCWEVKVICDELIAEGRLGPCSE